MWLAEIEDQKEKILAVWRSLPRDMVGCVRVVTNWAVGEASGRFFLWEGRSSVL